MAEAIRCRYCEQRHMPRLLCDPAKKILDALYARGQAFDMPTVELVEPLPADKMGLDGDMRLMTQLVVQAATVQDPTGVPRGAVVLTGRDVSGPLPRWLYVATDEDLLRSAQLYVDMTRMAIRRAGQERTAGQPG